MIMLFTLWRCNFHCFCLARTFVGSWMFKLCLKILCYSWERTSQCNGVKSTGSRSYISEGICWSCVWWGSVSMSWRTVQRYFSSSHCLPLQNIVLTLIPIQRSSLARMQSVARGVLPFLSYMDKLLPVLLFYSGE